LSAPEFEERSRILTAKAEEDATAVRELVDNDHISLPRHDIDYLLDVLDESPGARISIERDLLTALTVYAVPLRYEELADTEPLDRTAARELVDDVAAWALAQLRSAGVK